MYVYNRPSEFHLRPQAIRKLIESATSPRDRLVIAIFAFTGMRRAELRSLKVEDIDFKEHRITIRHGKGGKTRIVFFPQDEESVFLMQIATRRQGYLFPGRSGCITLRTINNIVARIGRAADIQNPNPRYKNINPHLFRHSVARNWKRTNSSLESLQKILGHASIKTTLDLYGTESMDETAENYHKMVDRLVHPPQGDQGCQPQQPPSSIS